MKTTLDAAELAEDSPPGLSKLPQLLKEVAPREVPSSRITLTASHSAPREADSSDGPSARRGGGRSSRKSSSLSTLTSRPRAPAPRCIKSRSCCNHLGSGRAACSFPSGMSAHGNSVAGGTFGYAELLPRESSVASSESESDTGDVAACGGTCFESATMPIKTQRQRQQHRQSRQVSGDTHTHTHHRCGGWCMRLPLHAPSAWSSLGRSNTVDHHFACAHTSVMCVCCVCAFA